jgi:ureidoacrylate peracid hydrolase
MAVDIFSSHMNAERIKLDPDRTAVLVVDMINEFCKPGGKMVLPGSDTLIGPQRAVIDAARKSGAAVIWVRDSHRPQMRRDREWIKRTPHATEGSWGAEVVADLGAQADDIHVFKHRYSSFFQTDLDLTLKDMMIEQLVVFGVVTNICVRSTVHDAFFNGYAVVVPRDCCAATGPREQESTLYDIATHFGIVADAAGVVAALSTGAVIENAAIAA